MNKQEFKNTTSIGRKLTSSSGESIAEILVASVVISLGSILLATMINASVKIVRNSENAFDSYYQAKNKFNEGTVSSNVNTQLLVETTGLYGVNPKVGINISVDYAVSDDGKYTFSTYRYRS